MKEKLLLIDAYSIICRGYYALPLLSNENGQHTNALLGFLNTLFRTIDEDAPKYIAVAFDENAPTFRHEIYKEYKGQRKPMPLELKEQVPYVKEVLKAMNIKIFSKAGYEADDILGSLANKFSSDKLEVTILSGDKDMLQLATDDIKIRLVKTVKNNSDTYIYYSNDVKKEFGVTPSEFIELKAIMGDSSDNIPGIKGVGKVTASKLIAEYNSINNIYENLDNIKKPSIVKAFLDEKDKVALFKKLVTIVTDVDIDCKLDELKINNIFNKDSYQIIEKYNLKSLYKKFSSVDKKSSSEDDILAGFTSIDDCEDIINIEKISDDDKNYAYDLKERYKKIDTNKDIFSKFTFDDNIEDLKIMSYLVDPLKKDYSDIYYKKQNILFDELKKSIDKFELNDVYENIEKPLVKVLYNMEKIGIEVDEKFLIEFSNKLSDEIIKIEKNIYKYANKTFNINSPKQVGEVLFEDLKLDYERKNNEKKSTGIEVLQKLLGKHPIIEPLIEYRTYSKLLTTYALVLPKFIVDKRIHTNFNQTETATGRLSSDNPNLQNIPIKTKLGRELRKAFIPREGYIFIDADYSQIELRILAILSCDENLINAYKNSEDVHTTTASEVFDVPYEKVSEDLRRKAKAINFGIVYGMSSHGLGEGLSIDTKEAKAYIDKYFEKYKKVKEYLDRTVENAKNNGYIKTYYGRIRPIPEFTTGNYMQKAFAKRVAMNSPIQGTAADIIKIAMVNIDKELEKKKLSSRIILQVHDEILIECKIGEEEAVKEILYKCMTDYFKFSVDLKINISMGKNWEEAH